MRSTSPARRRTVHLSGRRSAPASSPPGSSQFSPGAPGPPPARPHGRRRRRSVISDTVHVLQHLEVPLDALAARRRPRAAAPPAQPVAAHPHREGPLQRLDRRVLGVGHAGVDAAHARAGRGGRPARRRRSRSTPSPSPPMSTLFIVPWPAAPTRSGTAWARAPRQTSATRWLTSTLPAPTAAGGRAATIVPGGATTVHRPHGAAVGRDGRVGGRPQGEGDGAHGHRLDRVDVARPLRRRCR